MRGAGRVNVAQGAVMTAQGLGAAASPALGGWLAQRAGYPVSFTALGAIALASVVLWLLARRSIGDASAQREAAAP